MRKARGSRKGACATLLCTPTCEDDELDALFGALDFGDYDGGGGGAESCNEAVLEDIESGALLSQKTFSSCWVNKACVELGKIFKKAEATRSAFTLWSCTNCTFSQNQCSPSLPFSRCLVCHCQQRKHKGKNAREFEPRAGNWKPLNNSNYSQKALMGVIACYLDEFSGDGPGGSISSENKTPFRSRGTINLRFSTFSPPTLQSLDWVLSCNAKLTTLNLSDSSGLSNYQFSRCLISCKSLRILDLSRTQLRSSPGLLGFEKLTFLTHLILDGNRIDDSETLVELVRQGNMLELSVLDNDLLPEALFPLLDAQGVSSSLILLRALSPKFCKRLVDQRLLTNVGGCWGGFHCDDFLAESALHSKRNRRKVKVRQERISLLLALHNPSTELSRKRKAAECALYRCSKHDLFDPRLFGLVWEYLYPSPPGTQARLMLRQLRRERFG